MWGKKVNPGTQFCMCRHARFEIGNTGQLITRETHI